MKYEELVRQAEAEEELAIKDKALALIYHETSGKYAETSALYAEASGKMHEASASHTKMAAILRDRATSMSVEEAYGRC